ncbi:MAG: TRAP transporter substrate-binding protein [Synergistaceae bacterium]|nr:TRAP transporter substrate-binding protein [Synergistaceae bacterium]
MKRSIVLSVVTVIFTIIFAACTDAAEPVSVIRSLRTSMPTVYDETHGYTQAFLKMNEYLNEASGGTLTFDLHPGGRLGDERSVFESVQMGLIDAALFNAPVLSGFTNLMDGFDLPYLWVDENGEVDTALHAAVVGSEFARGYLDRMKEVTGVHGLGFFYNAPRDFFLNKPFNSLADAPSIKLRSMQAEIHIKMYEAMGFLPVPMAYGEIYQAMNTGSIDGFEDTAVAAIIADTYEVSRLVVKSGHATASPLLIMSRRAWDSLNTEEREMMMEAARIGRQTCYDTFAAAMLNAYDFLEKAGLEIKKIDHAEAIAACQPVIDELCDQNPDFKAIYDYVKQTRESM